VCNIVCSRPRDNKPRLSLDGFRFSSSATINMDMDSAEVYEQENVHEVYQQIAEHFSSTRYKVCVPCPCPIAGLTGFF